MTKDLKLPEVGKRYRFTGNGAIYRLTEYGVQDNYGVRWNKLTSETEGIEDFVSMNDGLIKIFGEFEELPEDNIGEKLTTFMGGKSKIPQFIVGNGKKEQNQV